MFNVCKHKSLLLLIFIKVVLHLKTICGLYFLTSQEFPSMHDDFSEIIANCKLKDCYSQIISKATFFEILSNFL